jgi:hypothetical protein
VVSCIALTSGVAIVSSLLPRIRAAHLAHCLSTQPDHIEQLVRARTFDRVLHPRDRKIALQTFLKFLKCDQG